MSETNFRAQIKPDRMVFKGTGVASTEEVKIPLGPPWRRFDRQPATPMEQAALKGRGYVAREEEKEAVNTALNLRRPLLVTGTPGTGKSTLAHAIAYELNLGAVLEWPITSRSTLQQGLYQYDAIGRLQEAARKKEAGSTEPVEASDIGDYIRLGPLGTALYDSKPALPRVLLIDEIDKSDIDLPNDLLHVFEEGKFEIPELSRLAKKNPEVDVSLHDGSDKAPIKKGRVRCTGFPLVILTSNNEREFPPAFLRRCIRLDIIAPNPAELAQIVRNRVGVIPLEKEEKFKELIQEFQSDRDSQSLELATDQLLNAVFVLVDDLIDMNMEAMRKFILRSLNNNRAPNKPDIKTDPLA